jgi:transposase InsO family protein
MHTTSQGTMVIQRGREVALTFADRSERLRLLIRDRDQKFTTGFDEVFRSDGIESFARRFAPPQANGVAERFVRTVRSECLDWRLMDQQHLKRVLEVFVTHYTTYTDPIEHCLSRLPSQDVHRSRRRLARFVFTVATGSVV